MMANKEEILKLIREVESRADEVQTRLLNIKRFHLEECPETLGEPYINALISKLSIYDQIIMRASDIVQFDILNIRRLLNDINLQIELASAELSEKTEIKRLSHRSDREAAINRKLQDEYEVRARVVEAIALLEMLETLCKTRKKDMADLYSKVRLQWNTIKEYRSRFDHTPNRDKVKAADDYINDTKDDDSYASLQDMLDSSTKVKVSSGKIVADSKIPTKQETDSGDEEKTVINKKLQDEYEVEKKEKPKVEEEKQPEETKVENKEQKVDVDEARTSLADLVEMVEKSETPKVEEPEEKKPKVEEPDEKKIDLTDFMEDTSVLVKKDSLEDLQPEEKIEEPKKEELETERKEEKTEEVEEVLEKAKDPQENSGGSLEDMMAMMSGSTKAKILDSKHDAEVARGDVDTNRAAIEDLEAEGVDPKELPKEKELVDSIVAEDISLADLLDD